MGAKTYNPKKVIVIFGGMEIKGFSEDSIVEIEPLGDGITSVVGCDGSVTRNIDPDTRCKITLKLNASSSSNDFLSITHLADRNTGKGILPFLMKDLSGRTTFFASQAWVTKFPNVAREKESSDSEWVLETGPADLFVGGHS